MRTVMIIFTPSFVLDKPTWIDVSPPIPVPEPYQAGPEIELPHNPTHHFIQYPETNIIREWNGR